MNYILNVSCANFTHSLFSSEHLSKQTDTNLDYCFLPQHSICCTESSHVQISFSYSPIDTYLWYFHFFIGIYFSFVGFFFFYSCKCFQLMLLLGMCTYVIFVRSNTDIFSNNHHLQSPNAQHVPETCLSVLLVLLLGL